MLKEYLRSRKVPLVLAAAIIMIFSASWILFEMPVITFLYPVILSAAVLVITCILDLTGFRRKHEHLTERIYPEDPDMIDRDYMKIIDLLMEEEKQSHERVMEDYRNRMEYYTIWAHQIKTPIASMRLNLQAVDSDLSRRLGSDLNRIESYVEMVLTFLRLDSDSTDYLIRNHDLDEMVRSSVKKFSREFILKKLKLDFRPSGYTVLTDEKWLSFVIEQVISNAVKYTSEGGVTIAMKDTGILSVEDTGIGIMPEDLPRIFENGYTGFNGREDRRASGIGLYLCRRICENLGHRIWAESVPGKGTCIYLDLTKAEIGIE